jgi:hypothetical protein
MVNTDDGQQLNFWLISFAIFFCEWGKSHLQSAQSLIISGGCSDSSQTVLVQNGQFSPVPSF